MNYNHLHYFYMVVREGSVSAASRQLGVSQPSLSSQIKVFERSLGVSLFERKGNRLELTASGKGVYANAAQMFEISAAIPRFLGESVRPGLTIRLGVADEIERPFAVNLVRTLFKKWKRENPPTISFTAGPNDQLIDQLRGWSIDAILTNRPSSFSDLEIAGSLVMPTFLATGYDARSAKKGMVSCAAKEIPKIMKGLGKRLSVPTTKLKLREEIDGFLSGRGETYPIVFESDTIAATVRAIIDGVGVGFVPLPYVLREVVRREITIFGPKEGLWRHTLFLMVKKGRAQSPGMPEVAQAFEDLKTETMARMKEIASAGKS